MERWFYDISTLRVVFAKESSLESIECLHFFIAIPTLLLHSCLLSTFLSQFLLSTELDDITEAHRLLP